MKIILVLGAVLSCAAPVHAAEEKAATAPKDARPAIVERVETRMVQVAVSVVDPKVSPYASVPGLKPDDFKVKLDGRELAGEDRARLAVDEICGPAAPMARPVLAVIDFNYVDDRGRSMVAQALDDLAAAAPDRPEMYKVYALTRQLRLLTDGFTKSPEALHEVAELVRSTTSVPDHPTDRTPALQAAEKATAQKVQADRQQAAMDAARATAKEAAQPPACFSG